MKINWKNKYIHFLLLQLIFLGLAVMAFLPVLIMGKGLWSTDNIFHWQRINEVAQCIKHGIFPQFNNYMSYRGIGDSTFYPWLTFLPFALLDIVHVPPIVIIDVLVLSFTVVGYDVSYYSYYSYQHSRQNSFVFALLYNFTVLFTSFYEPQGELAELLSLAFVPMAFFGWLKIMHGGHSKMLLWGLTAMLYTHLVSTAILCALFALLTPLIMNWHDWKMTMKKVVKSGLYFSALTCAVWLPIIILMMTNHIQSPQLRGHMKRYAVAVPVTFKQFLLANGVIWCAMEICAIVIGFLCWRLLTRENKIFFVFALAALVANVPWHVWNIIEKTPIGHLQYPFRLMFVSHFLLAFLLTQMVMKGFLHETQVMKAVKVGFLIFVLGMSYFWIMYKDETPTALMSDTKFNLNNPTGAPSKARMRGYSTYHRKHAHGLISYAAPKLTNYDMRSPKLLNTPMNMDYARENALHYLANTHNNKRASKNLKGNATAQGVTLNSRYDIKNGLGPIITYQTQKYYFYLNGRRITPVKYEHNQPVFRSIPKGYNKITYRTPIMWYRWLAIFISISALICFSGEDMHSYFPKR